MTAPSQGRPLPGCPARHGQGASIADPFTLAALDAVPVPGGEAVTEVFGWFGRPGQVTGCVLAAGFDVPAGSAVARACREIAGSPALTHVGDRLRASVLACPCTQASGQCPALDAAALITAIRHAARAAGWPQQPPRPGPLAAIVSCLPRWVTR